MQTRANRFKVLMCWKYQIKRINSVLLKPVFSSCNLIETFVVILSNRSKWKSQEIASASRHCVDKMAVLNTRPLEWNGFNRLQKESGRHVACSAGDLQCCLRTICGLNLLMTEWCDAGSSADFHSDLSSVFRWLGLTLNRNPFLKWPFHYRWKWWMPAGVGFTAATRHLLSDALWKRKAPFSS